MPTPTRYPDGGVNNVGETVNLNSLPFPDPTRYFTFCDDFYRFDGATSGAHDWLVTNASSGTFVVQQEIGGTLLVTNGGADNNFISAQYRGFNASANGESFKFDSSKDLWFKTRFKLSDATDTDFLVGLLATNVDPITAVANGIYFLKPDDATAITFRLAASSTVTSLTIPTVATTGYMTLGFHYDPVAARFNVYANDVRVASQSTLTNAPTVTLTPTFTLQNGAGAAKTVLMDYIFASCDIAR